VKVFFTFLVFATGLIQTATPKEYLLGRFDPSKDARFVQLTSAHAQGSALNGFLRQETFTAFAQMAKAAEKDGVKLIIISATRNFEAQKRIWESKWTGKTKVEGKDLTTVVDLTERARLILLYSSMPGTSRHHWGTDIDLNSLDSNYFLSDEGLKVYQWLTAHANEFGFCQPYTSKQGGRTGYEEEKWHWSYLPLSKVFLEEYKQQVTYDNINSFEGSEQAPALQIIDRYVDGVACR
jgi:D-alanyl-D-alanine carboxypeptidase